VTASQLAELNGLLALATDRCMDRGDGRDKQSIADDLLRQAAAPDVEATIDRLAALCRV
jgi:hypothetical protein